MKKIAYLFVAFAFFGVIALSSCKSKTAEPLQLMKPLLKKCCSVVDSDTVAVDTAAVVK